MVRKEVRDWRRISWSVDAVAAFMAGDEDILVLPRPALGESLVKAIVAGRLNEYRSRFTARSVSLRARQSLNLLGIECSPLLHDLTQLMQSFLAQFDLPSASLRVEMIDRQPCPKFHCDNVAMRLVTTYYGPTTEYRDMASPRIESAPLGALVFLKGRQHPTHRGRILHRSPEVPPGSKRLCVVIDD